MPESTILETERKAAMDYAINLANHTIVKGSEAKQLAARANLVNVLYRAIVGYEIAKPEVVEALLKE